MDKVFDVPPAVEYDADKSYNNSNDFLNDTEWEELKENCPQLKHFFEVTIPAANSRKEIIGTTMFIGCENWLKESIIQRIKYCLSNSIYVSSNSFAIDYTEHKLTSFLTSCPEQSLVLLPGDLNKYPVKLRELINEAINKHTLTITIGKGPSARTITLDMPDLSVLIFCDNVLSQTDPLSLIIQNVIDLRFMSKELLYKFELRKLIMDNCFTISEDALATLAHEAKISAITPRQILRPVIDCATLSDNSTEITIDIINKALNNIAKRDLPIDKVTQLDSMEEFEFERLVYSYFEKNNYNCVKIKDSTEHGVNLIAERDDFKIGIQIAYSKSQVVLPSVKDIIDDIKSMNLDKGYVITNRYYSEPVKKMAKLNRISLWDKSTIVERFL